MIIHTDIVLLGFDMVWYRSILLISFSFTSLALEKMNNNATKSSREHYRYMYGMNLQELLEWLQKGKNNAP